MPKLKFVGSKAQEGRGTFAGPYDRVGAGLHPQEGHWLVRRGPGATYKRASVAPSELRLRLTLTMEKNRNKTSVKVTEYFWTFELHIDL